MLNNRRFLASIVFGHQAFSFFDKSPLNEIISQEIFMQIQWKNHKRCSQVQQLNLCRLKTYRGLMTSNVQPQINI